jgi:hypothetical protein
MPPRGKWTDPIPVGGAILVHGIWFAMLVIISYHGLMMYLFIAACDVIWAAVTRGFYWWSPTGKSVSSIQARLILATLIVAWLSIGVYRLR